MGIIGRRGQRTSAHRMLRGMIDVQTELQEIRERNRRVEMNKAWETSLTRRLFIAVVTYCTATLFLWLIDVTLPYLNALVPTGLSPFHAIAAVGEEAVDAADRRVVE
jgi:hypothetical protein